LGLTVQWYVYLISIPAGIVLGQLTLAFINRPIAKALSLRHKARERMLFFKCMSLPKPRELAVSFRDIRDYDEAVKNMKEAQLTFADLGAQFFALSESEPALRFLLTLFGLSFVRAGQELIDLSEAYSMAKSDSDGCRQHIERALHATSAALTLSRHPSHYDLLNIRLEPMYLRGTEQSISLSGDR
jgi:hypothetical protein